MKNENIKVGDNVPPKIRLEVYKEALNQIKKQPDMGLCLLLPVLLWGLKSYLSLSPSGNEWFWEDTEKRFPEIKGVGEEMNKLMTDEYSDMIEIRRRYLTKAIKKLSNEKTRSQKTL